MTKKLRSHNLCRANITSYYSLFHAAKHLIWAAAEWLRAVAFTCLAHVLTGDKLSTRTDPVNYSKFPENTRFVTCPTVLLWHLVAAFATNVVFFSKKLLQELFHSEHMGAKQYVFGTMKNIVLNYLWQVAWEKLHFRAAASFAVHVIENGGKRRCWRFTRSRKWECVGEY